MMSAITGLGRELVRALAGTGVAPRMVSDRPLEWRLGQLTVAVAAGRARLRYAREPVGATAATAPEIAVAWRRALDRLDERSLPPDKLLAVLAAAYRALARRGTERVPLVAVRASLDCSRAQFSWDLARLRRERRLVGSAGRLDLGIATGLATSRRSNVVWIEDDGGGGAFYQTLRFTEPR